RRLPFGDDRGVSSVDLFDEHVDALRRLERNLFADDVRLDRQFPSATIYEHGQGDPAWPAEIGQLVERGADGSAGVEHVVDDDDVHAVDIDGNARLANQWARANGLEVVAIERDVQRALRHVCFLSFGDRRYDLRRELNAAALNADDDETFD